MSDVFKELREEFAQLDRPLIIRRTAALTQATKIGLKLPRGGDEMTTSQIETAVKLATEIPLLRAFIEPQER